MTLEEDGAVQRPRSAGEIAADAAIRAYLEASRASLESLPTAEELLSWDAETRAYMATFDLLGADDAIVRAPGVDEQRWSDVNRKFCELFRETSD